MADGDESSVDGDESSVDGDESSVDGDESSVDGESCAGDAGEGSTNLHISHRGDAVVEVVHGFVVTPGAG
jgi:hypothetical protein